MTYLEEVTDIARDLWCTVDLEIDDVLTEKDFSIEEEGTWVRAWVWVSNEDLQSLREEESE